MGQLINSVLGPIAPDDLGITLVHEHLIFGYPGWQYDTAATPYDREKLAGSCVEKIREARRYGVKTIVDATPNDGTRDPELYKIVAEKTGVNIICATGLYTEKEGCPVYFKTRAFFSGGPRRVIDEICEIFVRDITEGIGHSGVREGAIKVGTGKGAIHPYEEMVLEAAAMAQKETGVPIITHTEAGTMAPQQADFLIGKGADPGRLAIGHMCGNADVRYHEEVLSKGPYLSFDRFGLNFLFPDQSRTETVAGLIKLGYENKILLSHDFVMNWLGREFTLPEPAVAGWNLAHLFKNIIPALKEAGVTDGQIRTVMVDNPRRLFTGE